jgi:hypothetical protein
VACLAAIEVAAVPACATARKNQQTYDKSKYQ